MSEHPGMQHALVAPGPLVPPDSRAGSVPWPGEGLLGRPRRHKAGTTLYHQGDTLSTLHLIANGAIKLIRANTAGRRVVVGIRSAGWLLGAPSFILDRVYPVSAETLTDTTIRAIDARALSLARASDPALNGWLTALLAVEVVKHLEAQEVTLLGARQRLLRMILSLATACPPTQDSDGSFVIPVRLTHRDLADLLNTSRETATRLVAELAGASLARIQRIKITIPASSWLADQMQSPDVMRDPWPSGGASRVVSASVLL